MSSFRAGDILRQNNATPQTNGTSPAAVNLAGVYAVSALSVVFGITACLTCIIGIVASMMYARSIKYPVRRGLVIGQLVCLSITIALAVAWSLVGSLPAVLPTVITLIILAVCCLVCYIPWPCCYVVTIHQKINEFAKLPPPSDENKQL